MIQVNTGNATGFPDGTKLASTLNANGEHEQTVNATALPLPAGAATSAAQATLLTAINALLTELQQKTEPTDVQPVGIVGTPSVATGLSQPLTDAQLRTAPVPVSAAALPLPAGASTEATLAAIKAKTDNLDVLLSTRTKPADTQTADVTDRAARLLGVTTNANMDVALSTRLKPADTLTKVATVDTITNPLPAGTNLIGQAAVPPATLVVTAVSAANTAVTATLPAVAGQFHYISRIVIERVATTAIAGTALLTYTSTNLPGSWARTSGNAAAVGVQQKDVDEMLGSELKSSAANTATTIVAPAAGATGIVRITVYYRTAP